MQLKRVYFTWEVLIDTELGVMRFCKFFFQTSIFYGKLSDHAIFDSKLRNFHWWGSNLSHVLGCHFMMIVVAFLWKSCLCLFGVIYRIIDRPPILRTWWMIHKQVIKRLMDHWLVHAGVFVVRFQKLISKLRVALLQLFAFPLFVLYRFYQKIG